MIKVNKHGNLVQAITSINTISMNSQKRSSSNLFTHMGVVDWKAQGAYTNVINTNTEYAL